MVLAKTRKSRRTKKIKRINTLKDAVLLVVPPFLANRRRVPFSVKVEDFDHPAVGSRFAKVRAECGQEQGKFIVKVYESYKPEDKKGPYVRPQDRRPRANTEHAIMEMYRLEGITSIPDSFVERRQGNLLYMQDVGDLPAEKVLREEPEKQVETLDKILSVMAQIHVAGRKKGLSLPCISDYDRILRARKFSESAGISFDYWIESDTQKSQQLRRDFLESFDFLTDYLRRSVEQIIHGDLNTYHILFDNGKISVIDWEKAKAGHITQDLAGILYSPEVQISMEERERLLRGYKQRYETLAPELSRAEIEVDTKAIDYFIRTFYYSSVFECFRRAGRLISLRRHHKEVYKKFIRHYPGFRNGVADYLQSINQIAAMISRRKDGLFTDSEQENFQRLDKVLAKVAIAHYKGGDAFNS